MKIKSYNKISSATVVCAIVMLTFFSCKKKEEAVIDLTRKANFTLSGAQEVPAVTTTGSGAGQIIYDPTAKTISYSFNWLLGSTTATTANMHFHGAADGSDTKSSAVIIGLTGFATGSSGVMAGTTRVLTDVEADQLLTGKWYVNVHSSTVPGGELRGNIKF